jgi:hypothetical protein
MILLINAVTIVTFPRISSSCFDWLKCPMERSGCQSHASLTQILRVITVAGLAKNSRTAASVQDS